MPLPMPRLDQRTWSDLVSEARSLVPRYAPEWTDHNASDPGVTIFELLAWLSEILMFRADRVSAAETRAFLRWFGVAPLPAQVASTTIALRLPPGGAGATLAGDLKVADDTSGLIFQADDPVFVSPAWLELSRAEGSRRGQIWSQASGSMTDLSDDNCRPGFEFNPFGPQPKPGDAVWLGFDCDPGAPGQRLALHVWTATWETDAARRQSLIDEEAAQPPCPPPGPSYGTAADCVKGVAPAAPPVSGANWSDHYSARVAWEAWDGIAWQPLKVELDETRALTLSGPVRFDIGFALQPDPTGAPSSGRWWVRCRLVSGSYECPPLLSGIAINTVVAQHSATIAGPEVIGVSSGHALDTFYLQGKVVEQGPQAAAQPVVAGSLQLRLTSGGSNDDAWLETPNWDRTGPFDRQYLLDPVDNSVQFGNGRIGRVPPADWAIEAMEYRVGGGPLGNLPAGRLTNVLAGGTAGLSVLQPFAALGGAPAETLDQAHGRALAMIASPRRAITAADWTALALATPGVPVRRAMALPGYLAELGCWSAPGVVTVVVVPGCGHPPVPGPDFIAAIARYLQPRRPLTTELHVTGPTYVAITVSATLHVAGPTTGVAKAAQAALDSFFDPLTGGLDRTGWPFGRAVLISDLSDVLGRVPGVAFVDGLSITADSGSGRCDNVGLCPTDLVASQAHQLHVVEARP